MRVVVTGASKGIGKAVSDLFLSRGHEVHGIDILPSTNTVCQYRYTHHVSDVKYIEFLPRIENVEILINNAGVQGSEDDVETNLNGLINTTHLYGLQENIKSIVNMASVSAHNGAEFGEYVASKGGVLSYTKWTAKEIAKYGATCNSLSFGGVLTDLNAYVIHNEKKWNEIMDQTPMKKWATPEEAAEWTYFLAVVNRSCTAQDIIVDNGETYNHKFVW